MRWLLPFIILISFPAHAQTNSVYIDNVGDNPSVYVDQSTSIGSNVSITMMGLTNLIYVQQSDAAPTTSINIQGDGNIVNVIQENGNHTLQITAPTGGNNINVLQSGAAQKSFTLTINSPNVGVSVQQTNNTVPDIASMTITCVVGSCMGYSYIKH